LRTNVSLTTTTLGAPSVSAAVKPRPSRRGMPMVEKNVSLTFSRWALGRFSPVSSGCAGSVKKPPPDIMPASSLNCVNATARTPGILAKESCARS
jgi:hypothetical protein